MCKDLKDMPHLILIHDNGDYGDADNDKKMLEMGKW